MANFNIFPKAPQNPRAETGYLRELMRVLNSVIDGKLNNCGEVTLTNGSTSKTVKDILCSQNSVVILTPVSLRAANLSGVYVVAADGQFVINHANPLGSDAVFRYVIIG